MINQIDYPTGPAATPRALSVRFFGVGDAGCRALAQLERAGFPGAEFIAVNTDTFALHAGGAKHQLALGARATHGLGAGGDMQLGHTAAQEGLDAMREWCRGTDLVFFVAGLGGGTGSGATPVLARLARECEALVLVLATLPFDFEPSARQRNAASALEQNKAAADAVVTLPLGKMSPLTGENPGAAQSFTRAYELLGQAVAGVGRLLFGEPLFKLDFANFRAAFRGRHCESAFATVTASGPNRAHEIVEKLVTHPLLEQGRVLTDATSMLVSFAAAGDVALNEISRVMEDLNRQYPHAHPLFGAVQDATLGDELLVTIFAARHSSSKHGIPLHAVPYAAPAPVPAPVPAPTSAPAPVPGSASAPAPVPVVLSAEPRVDVTTAPTSLLPAISAVPGVRTPAVATDEVAPAAAPALPARTSRTAGTAAPRRKAPRPEQQQLPLEAATKGCFERCEPTLFNGEDLDIPTFTRRRVALN